MNVLNALVSGKSDSLGLASRPGKDGSSKSSEQGFSDTLNSLGKPPSEQNAANQPPQSTVAGNADAAFAEPLVRGAESDAQADALSVASIASINDDGLSTGITLESELFDAAGGGEETKFFDSTISNDVPPDGADATTDALDALTKLVNSLGRAPLVSAKTDGAAKGEENAENGDIPSSDSGDNADILTLLTATTSNTAPVAPTVTQNTGNLPVSGEISEGANTTDQTVVRLQKDGAPAIDLQIDTNDDGSMKLDASVASGNAGDVVQIVETRRFVALAPTSNAGALTTAIAADPDWASAMAEKPNGGAMVASTGQVVHTLKLQMNPVELGHVTAALKLVGDELSVHLTAHTLKGYSELQKDSSGILDALKSQGFSVEQVTVNLASGTDRQDSATGNRQNQDQGQSQQAAQQGGQREQEQKPQEQFTRQSSARSSEEAIVYDDMSRSEIPARSTAARPEHVYL